MLELPSNGSELLLSSSHLFGILKEKIQDQRFRDIYTSAANMSAKKAFTRIGLHEIVINYCKEELKREAFLYLIQACIKHFIFLKFRFKSM